MPATYVNKPASPPDEVGDDQPESHPGHTAIAAELLADARGSGIDAKTGLTLMTREMRRWRSLPEFKIRSPIGVESGVMCLEYGGVEAYITTKQAMLGAILYYVDDDPKAYSGIFGALNAAA